MKTIDPSDHVVPITRSHTLGEMSKTATAHPPKPSLQKLQRIASNGNLQPKESLASPPDVPFERSHSLDVDLASHMKRSLSLNPLLPLDEQSDPQASTQTTQQSYNHGQPLPSPQFGIGYGQPSPYMQGQPSPYMQGQMYPYDQQQQTAHNVFNSIMTPMNSGMASPSYQGVIYTPAHYALSPMVYRQQGQDSTGVFFSSPFTVPQTPINSPFQQFELPTSRYEAVPNEGIMRSVSMQGGGLPPLSHPRKQSQHMPAPHAQNEYYGASHNMYNGEAMLEGMLEELRIKMKGLGLTHPRGPGIQSHALKRMPFEEMGVHWSLRDVKNVAYGFAKDQFGSRFLQQKLQDSTVPQQEKDDLFEELSPHLPGLCIDVFGNYVVQKILEIGVGTREQHNIIYNSAIKNNMFELSKHMYGCRVIQKLVEIIFGYTSNKAFVGNDPAEETPVINDIYKTETQDILLMELSDIRSLVTDQNGNHVIQKCISSIKPNSRLESFYHVFRGQYANMSKHPYGCRVVQRVLENAELTDVYEVIKELQHHLHEMILNQYANYVIQHIVQRQKHQSGQPQFNGNKAIESLVLAESSIIDKINSFREQLYGLISANVLLYSKHKFGSNVVECGIKHGFPKEKDKIIRRIIDPTCLIQMMQDQYANYVVQKVIDNANPIQMREIVRVVQQNEMILRRLTFGKHIINKLKSESY